MRERTLLSDIQGHWCDLIIHWLRTAVHFNICVGACVCLNMSSSAKIKLKQAFKQPK